MSTTFPVKIDSTISLPAAVDTQTSVNAAVFNNLRGAVLAIESAIGTQPAASYGTIAARLNALENAFKNPIAADSISFGGDLTGTAISQTVIGLQTFPIVANPPTDGYALVFEDGYWTPTNQLTYTSNHPSYWAGSAPTTVDSALNRLAALLGSSTPIP